MEKVKKKQIYYVTQGLSFDWILALLCLYAGLIGIRLAGFSDFWKQVIEGDVSTISLGSVTPLKGHIRFQRRSSSAWQVLQRPAGFSAGDQISTEGGSDALLTLIHQMKVHVLPETLVVLHSELQKDQASRTWEEASTFWYKTQDLYRSFPELKRGGFEILATEKAKVVFLKIKNTSFQLNNMNPGDSVKVRLDSSSAHSTITFTAQGSSQVNLAVSGEREFKVTLKPGKSLELNPASGETMLVLKSDKASINPELSERNSNPAPEVPHLLGPTHGAHFTSSANEREKVTLRWSPLPAGLSPELEVHRLDDPEYKTHPELLISGASVDLPDGKYTWRLRTINEEGHHSEWSPYYNFTIQERVPEAGPVALVQHQTLQKVPSKQKKPVYRHLAGKQTIPSKIKLEARKEEKVLPRKRQLSKYSTVVEAAKQRIQEFARKPSGIGQRP